MKNSAKGDDRLRAPEEGEHRMVERILLWYALNGRDLPWRRTTDPYAIWISEVMLQQTRVETVIPYYLRFLGAFPNVSSLAGATLQEVLMVWENLGYYARARHLHEAAKILAAQGEGSPPDSWERLIRLPGIGAYTAGAVLSIAYGKRVPAVDGNVLRVLSRLFGIARPLDEETRRHLAAVAERLIPDENPGRFNQSLMDFGALLCIPKRPRCSGCPLSDLCLAFRGGLQEKLPLRPKKKPLPEREMTAGIIRNRRGEILVLQRKGRGLLAGLWKFPGGERDPSESLEAALIRTIKEEVGLVVRPEERLISLRHAYTHFRIVLHAFLCSDGKGPPQALGCEKWVWGSPARLKGFPFSKTERRVLAHLGGEIEKETIPG